MKGKCPRPTRRWGQKSHLIIDIVTYAIDRVNTFKKLNGTFLRLLFVRPYFGLRITDRYLGAMQL